MTIIRQVGDFACRNDLEVDDEQNSPGLDIHGSVHPQLKRWMNFFALVVTKAFSRRSMATAFR